MLPVLLALFAAIFLASAGICVRLAGQRVGVVTGAAVSVVGSLAVAIIPALALDLPKLTTIPAAGFLWIGLLAVITYPVARTTSYVTIRRIGAARAAPLFGSAPLWAILLAIAFLEERPYAVIIVGAVAIVAGVTLIATDRRAHESFESEL